MKQSFSFQVTLRIVLWFGRELQAINHQSIPIIVAYLSIQLKGQSVPFVQACWMDHKAVSLLGFMGFLSGILSQVMGKFIHCSGLLDLSYFMFRGISSSHVLLSSTLSIFFSFDIY